MSRFLGFLEQDGARITSSEAGSSDNDFRDEHHRRQMTQTAVSVKISDHAAREKLWMRLALWISKRCSAQVTRARAREALRFRQPELTRLRYPIDIMSARR